jgi:hypothetical protein
MGYKQLSEIERVFRHEASHRYKINASPSAWPEMAYVLIYRFYNTCGSPRSGWNCTVTGRKIPEA